jgi:hypothetical protein
MIWLMAKNNSFHNYLMVLALMQLTQCCQVNRLNTTITHELQGESTHVIKRDLLVSIHRVTVGAARRIIKFNLMVIVNQNRSQMTTIQA